MIFKNIPLVILKFINDFINIWFVNKNFNFQIAISVFSASSSPSASAIYDFFISVISLYPALFLANFVFSSSATPDFAPEANSPNSLKPKSFI